MNNPTLHRATSQGPNRMEEVSVALPFTNEAILSLNNGWKTFEQARSLFNVDFKTFKAKLLQEGIFIWNEFRYGPVRIHGGNCLLKIIFSKLHKCYAVQSTDTFKEVRSMMEGDLRLSPGCYKLTYKHPSLGNVLVETDRDWHYAVEFSRARGFYVLLDLKIFPSGQTADASDEDA